MGAGHTPPRGPLQPKYFLLLLELDYFYPWFALKVCDYGTSPKRKLTVSRIEDSGSLCLYLEAGTLVSFGTNLVQQTEVEFGLLRWVNRISSIMVAADNSENFTSRLQEVK